MQKKIAELEKKVTALEQKVAELSSQKPVKPKVKRAATKYNTFMSTESKKIREEQPGIKQADVMQEVASRWKQSKQNE